MKTLTLWLLVMGFLSGPGLHHAYVWHQIESQALTADRLEGDQS